MGENCLVGRWVSVDLPCFAYNFLSDGTGFYSLWNGKKEFTYTADEKAVKIHYNGDFAASLFEYFIEEDILSIQDSFGNFVKYKRSTEDPD